MKKYIGLVAVGMVLAGCQTLPTVETMQTVSYSIGTAAGIVANQIKIDTDVKPIVAEVVEISSAILPSGEETFADVWKTTADKVIAKYIDTGKITEDQKVLISSVISVAGKGLDYMFTVRYPKAKEYTDLMQAGLDGFAKGFLSTFKTDVEDIKDFNIDIEAYEWLKNTK